MTAQGLPRVTLDELLVEVVLEFEFVVDSTTLFGDAALPEVFDWLLEATPVWSVLRPLVRTVSRHLGARLASRSEIKELVVQVLRAARPSQLTVVRTTVEFSRRG